MIYILFKNNLNKTLKTYLRTSWICSRLTWKQGESWTLSLIIQYSVWLCSVSSGDESSNSLMPSAALGLISHLPPPLAALWRITTIFPFSARQLQVLGGGARPPLCSVVHRAQERFLSRASGKIKRAERPSCGGGVQGPGRRFVDDSGAKYSKTHLSSFSPVVRMKA